MPNSPIAKGAQTRFGLIRETVFGVTPVAPVFRTVPPASIDLNNTPKYKQSKRIRSDGMRAGQTLVGKTTDLKYAFELAPTMHDGELEAACRSTWVATPVIVKTAAEIASVAAAGVFTVGAGLGTPFQIGHLVAASGFANAANNGVSRATANAAGTVTLGALATVVDAAPANGAKLKVVGLRGAAAASITAVIAGGNAIVVATTNPATLGVVPGSWFRASGFTGIAANNGWYRCASITGAGPWSINCDVVPLGFAADAAAGQVVSLFYSDYVRPGNTRQSYAVEEAHLDLGVFKYSNGLVLDKYEIKLVAEDIIDVACDFVGVSGDWGPQFAGATYLPQILTEPYNSSSNLGAAYVNGAWVPGVVTGATVALMADAKVDEALGVFGAADIHLGSFGIEGTLEKFFLDTVVAARVMAGLPVSIVLPIFDAITGIGYVFDIRRTKMMDGNNPSIANADDALKEPYKFVAEVDETVGYMLHVQKIESYS